MVVARILVGWGSFSRIKTASPGFSGPLNLLEGGRPLASALLFLKALSVFTLKASLENMKEKNVKDERAAKA